MVRSRVIANLTLALTLIIITEPNNYTYIYTVHNFGGKIANKYPYLL